MFNRSFPIRPEPIEGESFKGFILRIANNLGYQELKELHSMIGINYSKSCYDPFNNKYKSFTQVLEAYLEQPTGSLEQHFKSCSFDATGSSMVIKSNKVLYPKICTECAKSPDDNWIRHDWLKVYVTHCDKHEVPLLSACPSCENTFDWIADIFDGCPCCGLRWADYSMIKTGVLIYQRPQLNFPTESIPQFLNSFYLFISHAARPYDFITFKHKTLPNLGVHTHNIFEVACALLTSKEFRIVWKQAKLRYWESFISVINNDQLSLLMDEIINQPIYPQILLPKNIPLIKSYDNYLSDCLEGVEYAELLLEKSQVATLLRINEEQVTSLVDRKLLMIASQATGSKEFFDLIDIDNFLGIIKDQTKEYDPETNENLIALSDAFNLAKQSFCMAGDALSYLLSTNVKFYYSTEKSEVSFNNIACDREKLMEYCDNTLTERLIYPLSKAQLKDLFLLDLRKLDLLLAAVSSLKIIKLSSKKTVYSKESLVAFFEQNFQLDRWATINGFNLKYIHVLVRNNGFNVIYPELEKDNIFIYKREEKIINLLKNVINHKKYKGGLPSLHQDIFQIDNILLPPPPLNSDMQQQHLC